ncbi:MAG: hypothetical protein A2X23_01415 [Chloroflexi bacterium GWC2_73_18]|nr:MAG: hypothetical protein A2X23_01415 [Chloroflexi bacterium GWC2_73_18]
MRLSEWRQTTQGRKVMTPKVAAVYEPVLRGLGAGADPVAHVVWGDDVEAKYTILASVEAGLAVVGVRVNVPLEGPRAAGKLVRWSRVQTSELSVESQRGHRLVSIQVENQILKGVDDVADDVAGFVGEIFARIDGRTPPELPLARVVARGGARGRGARGPAAKAAAAKAPAATPRERRPR